MTTMIDEHTARVRAAFEATPADYMDKMLGMRSTFSPTVSGSRYALPPSELRRVLVNAKVA